MNYPAPPPPAPAAQAPLFPPPLNPVQSRLLEIEASLDSLTAHGELHPILASVLYSQLYQIKYGMVSLTAEERASRVYDERTERRFPKRGRRRRRKSSVHSEEAVAASTSASAGVASDSEEDEVERRDRLELKRARLRRVGEGLHAAINAIHTQVQAQMAIAGLTIAPPRSLPMTAPTRAQTDQGFLPPPPPGRAHDRVSSSAPLVAPLHAMDPSMRALSVEGSGVIGGGGGEGHWAPPPFHPTSRASFSSHSHSSPSPVPFSSRYGPPSLVGSASFPSSSSGIASDFLETPDAETMTAMRAWRAANARRSASYSGPPGLISDSSSVLPAWTPKPDIELRSIREISLSGMDLGKHSHLDNEAEHAHDLFLARSPSSTSSLRSLHDPSPSRY